MHQNAAIENGVEVFPERKTMVLLSKGGGCWIAGIIDFSI